MTVIVLADIDQKKELVAHGMQETMRVEWIQSPDEFSHYPGADVFLNLHDDSNDNRLLVQSLPGKTIIINNVNGTLKDQPSNVVRINGWPTFLQRVVIEAACNDEGVKTVVEKLFAGFNRTVEWTPDIPGFITARVIAMIINEAFYAVAENVSSRADIDTAMKLGTNYPYGPFEWSEKIGLHNINALLDTLQKEADRYSPAPLLQTESKT
jgi:3-hydroxybutyryl-CoA dehydrogenase